MSLKVSEQTEAQIAEEARRQGITVDALLQRFINEHATSAIAGRPAAPELPVWRLGVIGSLHRRDIYSDVP